MFLYLSIIPKEKGFCILTNFSWKSFVKCRYYNVKFVTPWALDWIHQPHVLFHTRFHSSLQTEFCSQILNCLFFLGKSFSIILNYRHGTFQSLPLSFSQSLLMVTFSYVVFVFMSWRGLCFRHPLVLFGGGCFLVCSVIIIIINFHVFSWVLTVVVVTQVESAVMYNEHRPRQHSPDLRSLLLRGRIVYIGMPVSLSNLNLFGC